MAIYDCFQYFNEHHVVDLRFNILDKFVDKFVIVESTVDHQGRSKKLNFTSQLKRNDNQHRPANLFTCRKET